MSLKQLVKSLLHDSFTDHFKNKTMNKTNYRMHSANPRQLQVR